MLPLGALPASVSPPTASSPYEAVKAWIEEKYEKRCYCAELVHSQSAVRIVENKEVQANDLNYSGSSYDAARQNCIRHTAVHPGTAACSQISDTVHSINAGAAIPGQTSDPLSAPDLIDFSSWD